MVKNQNGTHIKCGTQQKSVLVLRDLLVKKSGYSFCKPNPYKPCPTIQKSLRIGNRQWGAFVHWKEQRTLSIEEIKRISSFPNDFVLSGNITKQWAIIGNSVMPKFMYNIAKHIKRKYYGKTK